MNSYYKIKDFNELTQKTVSNSPLASLLTGAATFSSWNQRSLFAEGYLNNAIVYRCVQIIASSVSNLPFLLQKEGVDGKLEDLKNSKNNLYAQFLKKPNPYTSIVQLVRQAIINYKVGGIAYIQAYRKTDKVIPYELHVLSNQNIQIMQSPGNYPDELPEAYIYTPVNAAPVTYKVNPVSGRAYATIGNSLTELFRFSDYNPLDPWQPLSPLTVGGSAVDNHNQATVWNSSLLKQSARPSGFWKTQNRMTETQYDQNRQILQSYSGALNAGKSLLLNGDVQYQQLGLSPVDMDFKNNLEAATDLIAASFNIPRQMVLKGESTYNNYATAYESFYSETVLPLARLFWKELNNFLIQDTVYQDIVCSIDESVLDALEPKRARRAIRLSQDLKDGKLTLNEARAEDGLPPYPHPEANMPLIQAGFVPLEDMGLTPNATDLNSL